MKKAIAAVYMGHKKPFEIREYPVVEPERGMARLKLLASGVCGTDVHIHDGTLGGDGEQIIGHEFVGVIDAADDARAYGLDVGDAVIATIASPCGKCMLCKSGDDANCVRMGVTNAGDPNMPPYFHGGYAQYNFSPLSNLVKIPDSIDPVAAAVFACAGPTALHAFALAAQANCGVEHARVAVVQGLGPVGMFAAAYLKALGIPHVFAITGRTVESRAALAKDFGVDVCYGLDRTPWETLKADITATSDGYGADVVFEASGNPSAFAQGLDLLRNRGVYLVPGQYSISGGVPVSPEVITFKALRIIGSSQYAMDDIRAYLGFLQKRPAFANKLLSITTRYPVEKVNDAFADIRAGRNIKTLLVP
ncbi:MAG: alcohol dehydrogenase catalytic domain-containing protein [Clostridiales bacterium]|nr:alcohol dehydrogenase catalytic domain-containing protein [Clostridiales bacterium]